MAVNTYAMLVAAIILIVVGFFLDIIASIYAYYYQKQISDDKIQDTTGDSAKPWIWIVLLVFGSLMMLVGVILLIARAIIMNRNRKGHCKSLIGKDIDRLNAIIERKDPSTTQQEVDYATKLLTTYKQQLNIK